MDISAKVERIEKEIEYINKQRDQLDSFVAGDNMQLQHPAQFVSIDVSNDDFKDGFIKKKQNALSDRKQELKEKLEAVQEIID